MCDYLYSFGFFGSCDISTLGSDVQGGSGIVPVVLQSVAANANQNNLQRGIIEATEVADNATDRVVSSEVSNRSNMSKNVLNNQNSLNNQNQNCSSRGSWMGTNSSTCSNSYTTNYQRFKKQYSDSPILRQILASSLGTCVSVLTLNPISVVKLRLQRQDIFTETTAKGAFRTIYKKDGILGFWAGSRVGLMQSLPSSVIYMTIYEKLKTELAQNSAGNIPSLIPGIAGGLARFYSATLIAPIEIVKTIQTGGRKESAITIAKFIYKNGGILGFYKGWSSTIMRDVPFSFIYWVSYERLKIFFKSALKCEDISFSERLFSNIGTVTNAERDLHDSENKNEKENSSTFERKKNDQCDKKLIEYSVFLTFLSGSTAGVVAALVTHPFDVLKTQQQLRVSEQIIKSSNANNVNLCNYNYINNFHTIINNINNQAACLNNNNQYNSMLYHPDSANSNNNNKPVKSLGKLINTEIFSSNNAYSIRMDKVDIEKMPQKNIMLTFMRENCNSFGAHFSPSNICKKYFPSVLEGDGLGRIFRERGVRGLYKGLNMRLLTVIPSSAIMVTVYEFVKKMEL